MEHQNQKDGRAKEKQREEGADTGTNRIHKERPRVKEQIERQKGLELGLHYVQ